MKQVLVVVSVLLVAGLARAQNPPPLVTGGAVRVAVLEFKIEETPGFLVTPEIFTATMLEKIPVLFDVTALPPGERADTTYPLVLKTACTLHDDHTLDLRLTLVSRYGDTLEFSGQRLTVDQAQDQVARLLIQSVDTLTVLTEPRGALVSIDQTLIGAAPLRYFPLVRGIHVVTANFGGPRGLVADTIHFPKTRTVTLKNPLLLQKPTTAKVLFQGAEPAEIWLDGKKLGVSDQGWIEVPPGQHTFEIVSPAFGTRQVTLKVEAGRRYRVKY